ncbi:hypothetical protein ACPOL_4775 [Acidisarcina polymorpha]|uniref:Uncharacterized protein n=1 Tax=Acidisarcina polymorpha TaxID=2211140 RepID=A0A2Z5G4P0_9BACT|nr:hypothetical protein ACPOL_4775 [Acidisarcina polymorpha]
MVIVERFEERDEADAQLRQLISVRMRSESEPPQQSSRQTTIASTLHVGDSRA